MEGDNIFVPAAISVILPKGEGLNWVTDSGYAHDAVLSVAKEKAINELIERDDFSAWWHKNLKVNQVSIDKKCKSSTMRNAIENSPHVTKDLLFEIPNEWSISTFMNVICLDEYPFVAIGLGTRGNIELAAEHAILESVTTLRGIIWEALRNKNEIYLSRYNEILNKLKVTKSKQSIRLNQIAEQNNASKHTIESAKILTTTISAENGYTVKAFSMMLQPEILVDSTPFVLRLLLRTQNTVTRGVSPFF